MGIIVIVIIVSFLDVSPSISTRLESREAAISPAILANLAVPVLLALAATA